LNYQWRKILADAIDLHLSRLAATIEDESDRQEFEQRCGELLIDFYNEDIVDGTPIGAVMWFPLDAADLPAKWLKCDGSVVSQATYPTLYLMLRNNFGSGGGNFNLPNLTAQFLYGAGNDAQIGATGGDAVHTLTTAEIPAHAHVQNTKGTPSGAVLTTAGFLSNAATPVVGSTTSTATTGGGNSHNNMPPYIRGYWCIKALP
jgi:microcystin-dependent protein